MSVEPRRAATSVVEPARTIPVRAQVDVLVAGGGLGGVSAAVAAARAGARTLLVERNGFPGGVATAGMCCSVFNSFYGPNHELIVKGTPLEFVDALAQAEGFGPRWHEHQGHIIYDVERGKLVLTDLLEDNGVAYLFDTLVTGALMDGDVLGGVVIDSKSGREAIAARAVVDATGDADVAALAGAPVRQVGEGQWARHSFVFRVGNVDVDRFVDYLALHPDQYAAHMDVDWTLDDAVRQYRETGTFLFPHGGGEHLDLIRAGLDRGEYPRQVGVHDTTAALQMHAIRDLGVVHMITGFCDVPGLDIAAITRAMADGRRMAFVVTGFFRKHVPGFEHACVIATADDLGIRASRWIEGEAFFTREMKVTAGRCDDSIGRGVVQHDVRKHPAPGAWSAQCFPGGAFDIPYRCLLPRKTEGLLMGAGRSVSASDPMLLRTMVLTMVVGQAAGAAAAVSVAEGVTPRHVDVTRVQAELTRQGVDLGAGR